MMLRGAARTVELVGKSAFLRTARITPPPPILRGELAPFARSVVDGFDRLDRRRLATILRVGADLDLPSGCRWRPGPSDPAARLGQRSWSPGRDDRSPGGGLAARRAPRCSRRGRGPPVARARSPLSGHRRERAMTRMTKIGHCPKSDSTAHSDGVAGNSWLGPARVRLHGIGRAEPVRQGERQLGRLMGHLPGQ